MERIYGVHGILVLLQYKRYFWERLWQYFENKCSYDSTPTLKDLPPALSSTPTYVLANAQPPPTRRVPKNLQLPPPNREGVETMLFLYIMNLTTFHELFIHVAHTNDCSYNMQKCVKSYMDCEILITCYLLPLPICCHWHLLDYLKMLPKYGIQELDGL